MKPCPECGQQRPTNAESCPHCGAQPVAIERNNVKRLGWLVVALALAGLTVAGARRFGVLPQAGTPVATIEARRPSPKSGDAFCNTAADLAQEIMTGRQMGQDMAQVMKAAHQDASRYMVVSAYERPRYRTEAAQTRAVQDFKNDMFLECVKAQSKG